MTQSHVSEKNIALSPVGYWPRRVRPSWAPVRVHRPYFLPLLLCCGLAMSSLAGCTQWMGSRQAIKTSVNSVLDLSMTYLAVAATELVDYGFNAYQKAYSNWGKHWHEV